MGILILQYIAAHIKPVDESHMPSGPMQHYLEVWYIMGQDHAVICVQDFKSITLAL